MSKKKNVRKDFESLKPSGDTFARIYKTMVTSEAFKSLSKKQRLLYVYMKMEYYGQPNKNRPDKNKLELFYFNRGIYKNKYELYTNDGSFYRDRDALIEKGFIDCVRNGLTTRQKSIYRFSNRWRQYGTPYFKKATTDIMSSPMLKKQREMKVGS